MATASFRRNSISQLTNNLAQPVTDHESKAALLWSAFKTRMGVTNMPHMMFNIQQLIHEQLVLSSLVAPITKAEIDRMVKMMPSDKAPGPDGCNGLFLKKCWPIFKEDFYRLCFDFFDGTTDLQSINTTFITLVPKINNPEIVNDFRTISLLNSCMKLITKILADRLQLIILKLLHKNQYGFIKNRTIQDCLAWCFEFIH
jgi:hypothetical protein